MKSNSMDFSVQLEILEENMDTEEEKEWIEPRLNSFNEDVENIKGITGLKFSKSDNILSFMIKSDLSECELIKAMNVFLIRDQEYFKFLSIELLPQDIGFLESKDHKNEK